MATGRYEDTVAALNPIDVPNATRLEYAVMDVDAGGPVSLLTDAGESKVAAGCFRSHPTHSARRGRV